MNVLRRGTGAMVWTAVRLMAVLTVTLGVVYPLTVTGIAQLALRSQANGSLVHAADGIAVGSSLLGQSFTDADGNPLPQYFQARPSAAGDGYDAEDSSGSNLGPEDPTLVAAIAERRAQIAAFNGVPVSSVPADAVTASGSGLDPHISPEYAFLQARRVATARHVPLREVRSLIAANLRHRDLGYLGAPRVNVVTLNLALDEMEG